MPTSASTATRAVRSAVSICSGWSTLRTRIAKLAQQRLFGAAQRVMRPQEQLDAGAAFGQVARGNGAVAAVVARPGQHHDPIVDCRQRRHLACHRPARDFLQQPFGHACRERRRLQRPHLLDRDDLEGHPLRVIG